MWLLCTQGDAIGFCHCCRFQNLQICICLEKFSKFVGLPDGAVAFKNCCPLNVGTCTYTPTRRSRCERPGPFCSTGCMQARHALHPAMKCSSFGYGASSFRYSLLSKKLTHVRGTSCTFHQKARGLTASVPARIMGERITRCLTRYFLASKRLLKGICLTRGYSAGGTTYVRYTRPGGSSEAARRTFTQLFSNKLAGQNEKSMLRLILTTSFMLNHEHMVIP